MLILTLRTDKPEAEIGLYENETKLSYDTWLAHRKLAETLHKKIESVLNAQGKKIADIQGLAVYQGPGSFTGLRIGITVANALAYSLAVPIVSESGPDWVSDTVAALVSGKDQHQIVPEYGAPVHITPARK